MPRPAHDANRSACAFPTEPQVPGSNTFSKFGAKDAANPVRAAGDIAQSRRDQGCVTYARGLSKLPFSSRKYFYDIGFGWA